VLVDRRAQIPCNVLYLIELDTITLKMKQTLGPCYDTSLLW